jgi:two-component system response regulator YesN
MLNIAIVDDEMTVLMGLNKILSKHCPEYQIVSMAQSPVETLRILEQTKVDVVITDVKMPDMDGIKLTKIIRTLYPQTTVIVLSGYSDFEFVRQTLKNGAHDYLLKPCHYQTVVDLLRSIENRVAQNEKKTKEIINRKLLEAVINGKRELPEEWSAYARMQLMVIKNQDYGKPLLEEHLKQAVTDENADKPFVDMITVNEHFVLLFSEPLGVPVVNNVFSAISKKGFRPCLAYIEFTYDPQCLEHAYQHCVRTIEFLEFNELSIAADQQMYQSFLEQQRKITLLDYFSGQTLVKFIMNGHFEKVQEYLTANFNQLHRLNVYLDPVRMKKDTVKQLVSLEHQLKEHGIDIERLIGNHVDYLLDMEKTGTSRALLNWLKKYTMTIVMNMEDGNHMPQYILAAIQYIGKHYMNDIFLKTISEEVYVNPWYFSTQFKKYIGLTFGEYVNQTRVRKAKEFLKQKDLKVYQVAEMVGFQDASYFSTVFKSIENISPKEYQKII